ncbi:NUDIX domain-containing protein [Paenibacillus kobensis]|uniref:NUDIX domain-containing protein n=1 Tax=Paenibacillus kobensis TaxID=59841 RepID=UPI000FD79311|nr:NUDIX hydrolase [Paenibacillus kobensis]
MIDLHSVSAGGVIWKDGQVLLVQVNYGSNKGLWMLPGGLLNAGESLEQAVVREVVEETGVTALPTRIIGIRSGVRQAGDRLETGIYVVFEMSYVSGELSALDGNEIAGIKFVSPNCILADPEVIDLSKHFVRTAMASSTTGLFRTEQQMAITTKYILYDVYSTAQAGSKD